MPAKQRGAVIKRGQHNWQARWRDENGEQRGRGGFETKTAAREWLDDQLEEVLALRRGDLLPTRDRPSTVEKLLDVFLDKHGRTVDAATKRKLTAQLRHARDGFGDRQPDSLRKIELEDWRAELPAGSRHDVFRASGRRSRGRSRVATRPVTPRSGSLTRRGSGTSAARSTRLSPGTTSAPLRRNSTPAMRRSRSSASALAYDRRRCSASTEPMSTDRRASCTSGDGSFSGGELKDGGKTAGSIRTVPLRAVVLEALDAMPPRIDTPVLFPAPRGGYIDIEKFRNREWTPALRAAGIDHRPVKAMRHTFATEAGVELSFLARIMGTSVRELEDTYFRFLRRTDDQLRAALDA